jgi:chromosome segregation ATPase
LADEAKREQDLIKRAQNQREKSRLQLEIENDKRDLARLTRDLTAKQAKLIDLKSKAERAEKELFSSQGKIKQKAGGIGYLRDEMAVHENKEMSHQADLAGLEQQISRLEDELAKLTTQADALRKEQMQIEADIARKTGEMKNLEQAHRSLEQDSKQVANSKSQVAKSVSAEEREIKKTEQEIFLQKRTAEGLAGDARDLELDITRLNKEKVDKERAIRDLEVKRDALAV